MSETVKITRAEVIPLSKEDTKTLREFKTDNGAVIFNFKVQTRVNDKAENSPRLYRKCSFYSKTADEADKIKQLIKNGALIEVEGTTNRQSFDSKQTGEKVYYDEIRVTNLIAIQVGQDSSPAETTEELPF
jgi:single-stranded DNA-binding protein